MKPKDILAVTSHRDQPLPLGKWKYYQEWNRALFLHWEVDYDELRSWVPSNLQIDTMDGQAWVSVVAFTMEKIRPAHLPPFSPISNFHEINIRTYVSYKGTPGVYFLSIEGGKRSSCFIARSLSHLPYRYSAMMRRVGSFQSRNTPYSEELRVDYSVGDKCAEKSPLDLWLTERYALFQDSGSTLHSYAIHHAEWPIFRVKIDNLRLDYSRFNPLLSGSPDKVQYSPGVSVLAW